VEHDNLTDSGREDIVMPSGYGPKVQVADRAARVSSELEVHQPREIRYLHTISVDGHQFVSLKDISYFQLIHGMTFALTRLGLPRWPLRDLAHYRY
jgi:hypothetical protein